MANQHEKKHVFNRSRQLKGTELEVIKEKFKNNSNEEIYKESVRNANEIDLGNKNAIGKFICRIGIKILQL